MLLEPLVLQYFLKQCCRHHWFYNISKNSVAITIGFTAYPKIMLLKPLVLATLSKRILLKPLVLQLKKTVAKISGCLYLQN